METAADQHRSHRDRRINRICPGRYLAETSLFMICACTLHTFSIMPPLDEHRRPKGLEAIFTTDLVTS